jgi:plastocyanin
MLRRIGLVVVVAVLGALPLLGPASSAQAAVGVAVQDNAFQPSSIQAETGTTVIWDVLNGEHSLAADDGSWSSGTIGTGSSFSRLFPAAGTYRYYCTIHGGPGGVGMAGVVVVSQPEFTTTTTVPSSPSTIRATTTTVTFTPTTMPPTSGTTRATTTTSVPPPSTVPTTPRPVSTMPFAGSIAPGDGLTVLSTSSWLDRYGIRRVVGQIDNTGGVNRSMIEVVVDVYDASGRLVATESNLADVAVLAPAERAGFEVGFSPPAGSHHYTVAASGQPTDRHPNHAFTVEVTNRYADTIGQEHIVGRVTNNNTTAAGFVSVYGTFFDSGWRVLDQEETLVEGSGASLAANGTGSFELIRWPGAPSYTGWSFMAESSTDPSPIPGNSRPGRPGDLLRPELPASVGGYWMVGADGRVDAFGTAGLYGAPTGELGKAAAVDLEPTPAGDGYWVLDDRGGVHPFGPAATFGDAPRLAAGEKATSLSATPTGHGYWVFTSAGRVFAYGDAPHLGDMTGRTLNGAVLDSVVTPSGDGYWMVASDGGIFAFGDATFAGSMGGQRLNQPVMSMAPDPDGHGYWLVASDGGIFAFDAPFYGSMGQTRLNRPISGIVPGRAGYLMVGEDGGIFTFGDVAFHGSLGANPPAAPVVAVALKP